MEARLRTLRSASPLPHRHVATGQPCSGRIDIVACRHVMLSPARRQSGLSNGPGEPVPLLMDSISTDGKPSVLSATHASGAVVLGRTRGRRWAGEREAFRRAELRHKETSELLRVSPPLGLIPEVSGPVGLRRHRTPCSSVGKNPGDPTWCRSAEWKPSSPSCADPRGSVHIQNHHRSADPVRLPFGAGDRLGLQRLTFACGVDSAAKVVRSEPGRSMSTRRAVSSCGAS